MGEHTETCACMGPGDRDCNCHLSYGFDTAEAMEEFMAAELAKSRGRIAAKQRQGDEHEGGIW